MSRMIKRLLLIVFAVSALTACGGGSDSGFTDNSIPTEPVGGIWQGSFVTPEGNVYDLAGAISAEGEAFLIFRQNNTILFKSEGRLLLTQPTVQGADAQVTGDLTSQIYGGLVFAGTNTSTVTEQVVGYLLEQDRLVMTTFFEGEETGTYDLTYNNYYDFDSSLQLIAGQYVVTDANNVTLALTIDSLGRLAGGNTNNCAYAGTVAIIDDFFNLYRMTVTVSACGELDGVYRGFAALTGPSAAELNGNLSILLAGENSLIAADMTRQ